MNIYKDVWRRDKEIEMSKPHYQTSFLILDKIEKAVERVQLIKNVISEPLWVAYSGGKDSVVLKWIIEQSGIPAELHYNVTSVDPPELVQFVKSQKNIKRDIPHYDNGSPMSMWNLIPNKMIPPTRVFRYCCEKLKEASGKGRITATGVRWAESPKRKKNQGEITVFRKREIAKLLKLFPEAEALDTERGGYILNLDNDSNRRMVEQCYRTSKTLINPIIDFSTSDIWQIIGGEHLDYCGLYDCGYKRLGCIGCPMASIKQRKQDFLRYPQYKEFYINAFDKMLPVSYTHLTLPTNCT